MLPGNHHDILVAATTWVDDVCMYIIWLSIIMYTCGVCTHVCTRVCMYVLWRKCFKVVPIISLRRMWVIVQIPHVKGLHVVQLA